MDGRHFLAATDLLGNDRLVRHSISISISKKQWSSRSFESLLHSVNSLAHGYAIDFRASLEEGGVTVSVGLEIFEMQLLKTWIAEFAHKSGESTVLQIENVGTYVILPEEFAEVEKS